MGEWAARVFRFGVVRSSLVTAHSTHTANKRNKALKKSNNEDEREISEQEQIKPRRSLARDCASFSRGGPSFGKSNGKIGSCA